MAETTSRRASRCRLAQLLGHHVAPCAAQRVGLGLAAPFGHRLGEVGKQHGEPQPHRNRKDEAGRCLAFAGQGLHPQTRGQHAADQHGEHHRIAQLAARIELAKRVDECPPHNRRIKSGLACVCFDIENYLVSALAEGEWFEIA